MKHLLWLVSCHRGNADNLKSKRTRGHFKNMKFWVGVANGRTQVGRQLPPRWRSPWGLFRRTVWTFLNLALVMIFQLLGLPSHAPFCRGYAPTGPPAHQGLFLCLKPPIPPSPSNVLPISIHWRQQSNNSVDKQPFISLKQFNYWRQKPVTSDMVEEQRQGARSTH